MNDATWQRFLARMRLVAIMLVVEAVASVLWSAIIWVELLPRWATYLGGPVIGVAGAIWLFPRLSASRLR